MYDLFFFALLFLVIPLGSYALISWAILYHITKYGFRPGANRKIAIVYSAGMLAVTLLIIVRFFAVDWNKGSFEDFLRKSNINITNRGTYGWGQ